MDAQTELKLREHFLEWSGGFPPDSEEQIYVYVELAGSSEVPADETTEFLRNWLAGLSWED